MNVHNYLAHGSRPYLKVDSATSSTGDIEMNKIQDFALTQSFTVSAYVHRFTSRSYSVGATRPKQRRSLCINTHSCWLLFSIFLASRSYRWVYQMRETYIFPASSSLMFIFCFVVFYWKKQHEFLRGKGMPSPVSSAFNPTPPNQRGTRGCLNWQHTGNSGLTALLRITEFYLVGSGIWPSNLSFTGPML